MFTVCLSEISLLTLICTRMNMYRFGIKNVRLSQFQQIKSKFETKRILSHPSHRATPTKRIVHEMPFAFFFFFLKVINQKGSSRSLTARPYQSMILTLL